MKIYGTHWSKVDTKIVPRFRTMQSAFSWFSDPMTALPGELLLTLVFLLPCILNQPTKPNEIDLQVFNT